MEHIENFLSRVHISSSPSHDNLIGSYENSFGALPTLPPFEGRLTFTPISGVKSQKLRVRVPWPQSRGLLGTTARPIITSTSRECHLYQRPI
jgi:hypothetical protein